MSFSPRQTRPSSIRLTVPGGTPNIAGIWLLVNRSAAQHHQYAAIDGSVDWSEKAATRKPARNAGIHRKLLSIEEGWTPTRSGAVAQSVAEDYRGQVIPERLASGKSMKKGQLPPEPRWLAAWPIV